MHRNSFIDAPRYLLPDLRLRGSEWTWFAGQITGAEGYVEAAACGLMAAIAAARKLHDLSSLPVPETSALGAVVAHLQNTTTADFQPANVSWAFTPPLPNAPRDKRERRRLCAERALEAIEEWKRSLAEGSLATV
jgi:methylenetetrahydrofolate--tRNA-(uracil-5-)-methyltransferase